jgi:cell division transport system permease protein
VKLDYLLRETGTNLRRNLTLGLAAIITVMVSLAMLGIALIVQRGVDQATARWQEGVEFIVFMNADATTAQLDDVANQLRTFENDGEVASFRFVDQQEAFQEFLDIIERDEIREVVRPEDMPPSFRVVPAELDADQIDLLAADFEDRSGVREVVSAQDAIRKLERGFDIVGTGVLFGGLILLGSSLLLIFNTIRMAMFARRQEMEVMKLVGATNWFIRVPFMFEGLIQGVLGGLLSFGIVWGFNYGIRRWLGPTDSVIALLQNFAVSDGYVFGVGAVLVAIGAAIGTIGSGIAVNRFLDV